MYKKKKKPEKPNQKCHVCGRQLTEMEVFAGHYYCGHNWYSEKEDHKPKPNENRSI
jgi:hypothetical protein